MCHGLGEPMPIYQQFQKTGMIMETNKTAIDKKSTIYLSEMLSEKNFLIPYIERKSQNKIINAEITAPALYPSQCLVAY